jgi:hypothetical protein
MYIYAHNFASNFQRNLSDGKGIRAAGVLEANID